MTTPLKINWLLILQQPPTVKTPSANDGAPWAFLPSKQYVHWLDQVQALCRQSWLLWFHEGTDHVTSRNHYITMLLLNHHLLKFFPPYVPHTCEVQVVIETSHLGLSTSEGLVTLNKTPKGCIRDIPSRNRSLNVSIGSGFLAFVGTKKKNTSQTQSFSIDENGGRFQV